MDFRLSEVGVDEVGVLGAACAARREFLKSSLNNDDQKKEGRNGNYNQKNQLASSSHNTFLSILLHISPLLLSFLFLPTVLKRFF